MSTAALISVLTQHAAASLDKQLYIADLLGERYTWGFDTTTGILHFDKRRHIFGRTERLVFSAQVLGSETELANMWLWAWANVESNILSDLLRIALNLKVRGESQGIDEFVTPELPLTETVNGHNLAAIATGLEDADFYYRCPYDGGAAFVVVKDPSFQRKIDDPLRRILFIFPRLIMNERLANHHNAFAHYLRFYQLSVVEESHRITGTTADGRVITGEFDELGRLIDLHAMLVGSKWPHLGRAILRPARRLQPAG